MLENAMKKAKATAATLDKEWLSKAKEIALDQRKAESGKKFETYPRIDLRQMGGSEEEPSTMILKAIENRKEVRTDRMSRPMYVFNAEVLACSASLKAFTRDGKESKAVFPEKYSIWENTTVLTNEMQSYAGSESGDITGHQFIIASYGTVKSKKFKGKDVYLFRVIPYDEAS